MMNTMETDEMQWNNLSRTMNAELDCMVSKVAWEHERQMKMQANGADALQPMCEPNFDSVLCWPPTPAGQTAVISCMAELNGVRYDTRANATRLCQPNGTWHNYTDYSACKPFKIVLDVDYTFFIYLTGYSISLIALFIACATFLYFKETHCVRNKIHANLFITYILSNFCWILSATLQATEKDGETNMFWCALVVLFRYFHMTTFFWMFVEGLYLFVQVIAAFQVDNTCIKLRHYVTIGWGLPLLIVIIWASLLSASPNDDDALGVDELADLIGVVNASEEMELMPPTTPATPAPAVTIRRPKSSYLKSAVDGALAMPSNVTLSTSPGASSCPFMVKNDLEYLYIVPILLVLGLNTFFLIWIMWVVITKLRSSTSSTGGTGGVATSAAHHEHHHQNWKAAKALLVIIPLLGITYLITIAGPSDRTLLSYYIFEHVRAFLLSIQGFAVTLPYCFLNTEIRNVVRCHWQRFQTTRYAVDNYTQNTRVPSARNSLSLYHGEMNAMGGFGNAGSGKGFFGNARHFSGPAAAHASHRAPLLHQSSLPTQLPSSSGMDETEFSGDGVNGSDARDGRRLKLVNAVEKHSTIDEASEEVNSGSDNHHQQQTVALLEGQREESKC